jgi:16S rRNA (uracil1498-N3)-methyltransferase
MDRMRSIMESALIQSQQVWMPVLREPLSFATCLEEARAGQLFIAHCAAGEKRRLAEMTGPSLDPRFILIGPEGDFTEEEIRLAFRARYISVSLGEHRLRSETAALAAAVLLKLM